MDRSIATVYIKRYHTHTDLYYSQCIDACQNERENDRGKNSVHFHYDGPLRSRKEPVTYPSDSVCVSMPVFCAEMALIKSALVTLIHQAGLHLVTRKEIG